MAKRAVILLSYGGPQNLDEVRPFMASILNNRKVSERLISEFERRYQAIGGASPLNKLSFEQARSLQAKLEEKGNPLQVKVGFLHSSPSIADALQDLVVQGVEKIDSIVMNPFRSEVSYQRYVTKVESALEALEPKVPEIRNLPSFHQRDGFIEAYARNIEIALDKIPETKQTSALLVFTAHSLPVSMAEQSSYVSQLQKSAELIAQSIGNTRYRIGFQSKSNRGGEPWVGPDIDEIIEQEATKGISDLLLAPIGFICDHLEVLYDLDIEAKALAQQKEISLYRAETIHCHPHFIEELAQMVTSE